MVDAEVAAKVEVMGRTRHISKYEVEVALLERGQRQGRLSTEIHATLVNTCQPSLRRYTLAF